MGAKPYNILVVDDIHDDLELMRRILSKIGVNVSCADSGKSALTMMKETVFDLILLDVRMPDMDGYGVIEEARRQGIALKKVLFISVLPAYEVRMEYADGYIQKPFGKDEFKSKVIQTLID